MRHRSRCSLPLAEQIPLISAIMDIVCAPQLLPTGNRFGSPNRSLPRSRMVGTIIGFTCPDLSPGVRPAVSGAKDLECPPSVAIVEVLSLNGKLAETPGDL